MTRMMTAKPWLCALLSVLLIFSAAAARPLHKAPRPPLPFSIAEKDLRPLRTLSDQGLQKLLEDRLMENKKWAGLIRGKKMAVGLVDLSDPRNARFARVNGNVMMYAASLPKLAILLAACHAIEEGSLQETSDVLHDMRIMISRSDNAASTRMMERIGMKKIEEVLTLPEYELYDRKRGGGLWVGKKYAKEGRRRPDPLYGFSHGASVTQICRFYYLLAMGKLVSRDRSRQMLDMMCDPEINHKFVNTLHHIVPEARLYRKSGTWGAWHADSALVWGPKWRRYIVAALIEDPGGEQIARQMIYCVEDVLTEINKKPVKGRAALTR